MTRSREPILVRIVRMAGTEDLPLPTRATAGAAGYDLRAAVREPVVLDSGTFKLIPTGIAIALPRGFEAQVRPRSGLALRHGVGMVNAPGTIDSDYRGEIGVILINHGAEPFVVKRGERIAQLVIAQVETAEWIEDTTLDETTRGAGGFGHTGTT